MNGIATPIQNFTSQSENGGGSFIGLLLTLAAVSYFIYATENPTWEYSYKKL